MKQSATTRRRRLPVREMEALADRTYSECLRDWIAEDLTPGTVVTSENELALRYDVTLAVARRVLARFERDGVIRREVGRGSILATLPNAATGATKDACLLLPAHMLHDKSAWLNELILALEAALSGYGVRLRPVEAGSPEAVSGTGIALTYHLPPEAPALAKLASQAPVLQLGTALPGIPAIAFDEEAAGRIAAAHLVEWGHQVVAFVGYECVPWQAAQDARLAGLQASLGLHAPAHLVASGSTNPVADPAALDAWLHRQLAAGVTAIAAANDHLAQTIRDLATAHGRRVPEDLSIIGFDDAHVWRPNALTTLRFPWGELGAAAARALLSSGGRPTADIRVAPQLIRRTTTGPVARA